MATAAYQRHDKYASIWLVLWQTAPTLYASPLQLLTTLEIGDGNAIARHGIHGAQRSFEFPIMGRLLQEGENSISITQMRALGLFLGVMYDYIRLEGPADPPREVHHGRQFAGIR